MESYFALKKQKFEFEEFSLIPIQFGDLEAIREWRNSQIDVLRQKNILTKEDQLNYFESVIKPQYIQIQPTQILFGFYNQSNLIGYGGLVHISWEDNRAEISFLLNPDYTEDKVIYAKYFTQFLNLITIVAFKELKFKRIFTETFDIRDHHIKVLETFGFLREGVMRKHICINNDYIDSIIHGYINEDIV